MMFIGDEKMAEKKIKGIAEPTIRRLPLYLPFLKKAMEKGQVTVSCAEIAKAFGFDPTQVRKDMAATGVVGTARVGFDIENLERAINKTLGWHTETSAVVAGIGNLGTALLGYPLFQGLDVVAAFDTDSNKIGWEIEGKKIFHVEKLPDLVNRLKVSIGIVTVPSFAAQDVVDLMVEGGIKGIWNFTPEILHVPDHVVVENVRLSTSLAVLTSKLSSR